METEVEREYRMHEEALVYLRATLLRTDGVVRYEDVSEFAFDGHRLPLMAKQQGIRKPAGFRAALSIRTVFESDPSRRPYADDPGVDGFQRYKWRGDDPLHADNVGLRIASDWGLPLIWFVGVASAVYVPVFPVKLVDEEPELQQFVVAFDEQLALWSAGTDIAPVELRRYAERITKTRLHQPIFRERVLAAYERRCALCRLRHVPLLEAAHIKPDAAGGQPVVPNGIAMCSIHHGAFDNNIIGVSPDYHIAVRPSVMEEEDGPMLRHGIQALAGAGIWVPRSARARPDRELLDERFAAFLAAS